MRPKRGLLCHLSVYTPAGMRLSWLRCAVDGPFFKSTGRNVDFEQAYHYGSGGTRPTSITYAVYDNGVPILGGLEYLKIRASYDTERIFIYA